MAYQDTPDVHTRAQEHLTKALNFQQMGMAASAEHELALARQLDPAIASDSRYQSLGLQRAEEQSRVETLKLPMRVAAILLLVDAGIHGLLWLPGRLDSGFLFWGLFQIGIDVFIAISLLRQNETVSRWTAYWAVFGVLGGGLVAIASAQVLILILQVAFSSALLLLVLGKPSTRRVAFAVVVYMIGYLGSLCGLFAWAVVR